MTRRTIVAQLALALAALWLACGAPDETAERGAPASEAGESEAAGIETDPLEGLSPSAQLETEAGMREDLLLERHPGDGGGSGRVLDLREVAPAIGPGGGLDWQAGEPVETVLAGSRARIRMEYRAGPHGIAPGGVLFLQTSPFWDWHPAQTELEEYDGYTTASTEADGVALEPVTYGQGLVGFIVSGRALVEGETVEVVYGAGPVGARVDRYAERESPIWFQVDADADGIRGVVNDSPRIETLPGPPHALVIRQPSTLEPGDPIEVHLALVDAFGNARPDFTGEVAIDAPAGLEIPATARIGPEDGGATRVEGIAREPGIHRIRASVTIADPFGAEPERQLTGESPPLIVREGAPRILWADLHGHSNLSDGTGTPEDFFRYARDVAGLDVVALTDHDHWGMRFLDANPSMWLRIQRAVAAFHDPGRFVTLLGYEWTSWLHGHRHVLYFEDSGPVLTSIDRDRTYETPAQLWDALRGRPALTFAHHSAGGPVATNWDYPPDPELEPVTEIASVHGSSEAPDSPRPIYAPVPGNYVRDALARGYRLGLIGSGDSHDGHPGLAQLASGGGTGDSGLAAIFAPELSREAVRAAMHARRVYATNGPWIFLRTTVDDVHEMGTALPARAPDGPDVHTLDIRVAAVSPLDRIELIRGDEVVASIDGEERRDWSARLEIPALEPGEFLYVRVVQVDGGAAWSSPYFGPPAGG